MQRLQLVDFRSYVATDLAFDRGPVVFLGPNGHGKTNLVEAIAYSSLLDSHRVHGDAALIRHGAESAVIRSTAATADRATTVELQLHPGRSNRVQVNGQAMSRNRDVVGVIRTAIFAPEHLRLIKGDPGDRRRFLDSVMVQVAPRYLGVRADFERVLKQRNAALRSLSSAPSGEAEAVLAAWDERFVPIAAELTWGRRNAVRQLAAVVAEAYREISPSPDDVAAVYDSSVVAVLGTQTDAAGDVWTDQGSLTDAFARALQTVRRDEVRRGVTLVGPHRDDLVITLNGHPARIFASQGESWSLALALQLASFHVLHRIADDPPILILDDVFAELDEARRLRLLAAVGAAEQILITAAVAADVPAELHAQQIVVTKSAGESTAAPVASAT